MHKDKYETIETALKFQYGGMLESKLEFLYDFCIDKKVLELGSMVGMSSYVIAHVAKEIHCVDAWDDGFDHLEHDQKQVDVYRGDWLKQDTSPNMLESFKQNCKEFLDSGKMKMTQGWTQDVSHLFSEESFDVLFIDADHSRIGVTRDVIKYYHTIKTGAPIIFHDYDCVTWPGVTQAILDCIDRGFMKPMPGHWSLVPQYFGQRSSIPSELPPTAKANRSTTPGRFAIFQKTR